MLTLRAKVVVSLIGMCLLTIAVGGLSARYIMLDRFDNLVAERAMQGLLREVSIYHETYGSWDAAVKAEPFFGFARRTFSRAAGSEIEPPPGVLAPGMASILGPDQRLPEAPRRLDDFDGDAPPILVTDNDGVVRVPTPLNAYGQVVAQALLRNAVPIMSGDIQIGYAISDQRIALSNLEIQYLAALKDSFWLSILLIAVIALPVGFLLGRKLTAPIKKLSSAVVAMQPGAVQQEVPVTSDDELGQLSNSFNIMSSEMASFIQIIEEQKARILETEELRKEGMASISHELRTPLNNCVAQANAMIDGIRPTNAEQMNLLSESLDHLTKLVDDLFQLALADVNALECAKDVVDLSRLAEGAIEARKADFEQKGSELIADIPPKLAVMGDAKRLRQILDNLLENCFRYANDNGTVALSLQQMGRYIELSVSDDGPGVSSDILEFIFDRFYREESSRNKTTGGTGLGLSLVKVWAEAQGGSVDAALSELGGLVVRVLVPIVGPGSMRSAA